MGADRCCCLGVLWQSIDGSNQLAGRDRSFPSLVYFPGSIFPVTAVGSNLFVTLMRCVVVIQIIVIYDLPLTVHLIWIPVGVFLSALLALGIGMMFAPLNCAQRDVQHFMRFVTRAGFFVSPVMWTAEMAMERGSWGSRTVESHGSTNHDGSPWC